MLNLDIPKWTLYHVNMAEGQGKELLTLREAMEYLKIRSKTTFYKLIKEGKIRQVRISPRKILYDKADLDRLIEESKRKDG